MPNKQWKMILLLLKLFHSVTKANNSFKIKVIEDIANDLFAYTPSFWYVDHVPKSFCTCVIDFVYIGWYEEMDSPQSFFMEFDFQEVEFINSQFIFVEYMYNIYNCCIW